MECKWNQGVSVDADGFSINRNILECKCIRWQDTLERSKVLIETYWNVNDYKQPVRRKENNVLIETYWNVNSLLITLS